MIIKQCQFSVLVINTPFWIREKCYMKKRIFNENNISMSYNCSKFTIQHNKTIICFELIVFLFKTPNVVNLSAATKNLRTNYIFFVKPACFSLIINSRSKKAMTNFWSRLWLYHINTQPAITYSKLTIETLEQGVSFEQI